MSGGSSSSTWAPSQQWEVKSVPLHKKLTFLRDQQMCAAPAQPGLALLYATDVLASHRSSVSDIDRFAITEQAIIAALDCGNEHRAKEFLRELVHNFSHKSVRVRKLQGMILEAEGNYDQAMKTYSEILKDSPLEAFVAKRFSAIFRAQGKLRDAIAALDEMHIYCDPKGGPDAPKYTFVQMFPTDLNAARELSSLYWATGHVHRSLHYAHECVLLEPFNSAAYTRVGELAFAAGKLDDAATAFAQSARLNDTAKNARALYGLWMVAQEIIRQNKKGAHSASGENGDVARARQLGAVAATKLKQAYQHAKVTAMYLDLMLQKQDQ